MDHTGQKVPILFLLEYSEVFNKRAANLVKIIYSGKATKFCEISTLLLTTVKSKLDISHNFAAFSEYMNFKCQKEVRDFFQIVWRSRKTQL